MDDIISDRGEFRLLKELILPRLSQVSVPGGLGDDCAVMPLPGGTYDLVVTSDGTPTPAIFYLGLEDYSAFGWLSVVVNASDLASAGATPLLFISSVEASPEMRVTRIDEFFTGMAEACSEFKLSNAGGNFKSGGKLACHGCAVGLVPHGHAIGRTGCQPGDYIVAIGALGEFICAFLRARSRGTDSLCQKELQCLLHPVPQIDAMLILAQAGLVSAASDNSDGILGALQNISERSECGIVVDMTTLLPPDLITIAKEFGYDPWNLALCWGDWQVICSIKADLWEKFVDICQKNKIWFWKLGRASELSEGLYGKTAEGLRPLRVLRNENFVSASYGLDFNEHLKKLLETPILV